MLQRGLGGSKIRGNMNIKLVGLPKERWFGTVWEQKIEIKENPDLKPRSITAFSKHSDEFGFIAVDVLTIQSARQAQRILTARIEDGSAGLEVLDRVKKLEARIEQIKRVWKEKGVKVRGRL